MTKKQQLGFQKLFLILAALPCCGSLQVSIPVKEYEVASGGDITLTCSFTPAKPEITFIVLTWDASSNDPDSPMKTLATYYFQRPIDIAPAYEGRAFMSVDIDKQESTLRLTKVTTEDNRIYQCTVLIPNDDEGTTAATTSLMVLDPPSKPICNLQGDAEYWNNITLTCMSEKGMPKPEYKWTTQSVQHVPRVFPPKTTDKNGVLSLFNISMETSGFFICTSTNRLGSASCNFTLAVMPHSMNIGSTAGIIVGVLVGVICVGVLIYCCRKKNKKEKYAQGSPEAVEFQDKDTADEKEQEREQEWDKSSNPTNPHKMIKEYVATEVLQENNQVEKRGISEVEDDQHSYRSGKGRQDDKSSDQHDRLYGSRDRLDDQSDRKRGSRDRLDDPHDRYGGNRDRLDDHRDRHGGSRDHLDDQRDRYGGSRDRLDDRRDRNGGSRDRLDDHRERHGGSRDRLDDRQDRYGGSRDRLDDQHRNQYK